MSIGDFGQPRVEALFAAMLERGRVGGSFLFEGPLGTGKEALAVELGRMLACEKDVPCPPKPLFARSAESVLRVTAPRSSRGAAAAARPAARERTAPAPGPARCNSCHKFDLLQHPDLLLVFPVPTGTWDESLPDSRGDEQKLNTIGKILKQKAENPWYRPDDFDRPVGIHADVLRDHVLKSVGTRPVEGRIRVVVISDAERITANMSNILLKTLEEPPENRLLVLTTAAPQALLPTILSRCQRIRFTALTPSWMEPRLEQLFGATPAKAKLAAAVSQGSMLAAARFLEGDLDEIRDHAFAVLQAAAQGEELELLEIAQSLASEHTKKRYLVPLVLQMIAVVARDAVLVAAGTGERIVHVDRKPAVEALSRALPIEALRAAVQSAETAERQIMGNAFTEHALAAAFLQLAPVAPAPTAAKGGRR